MADRFQIASFGDELARSRCCLLNSVFFRKSSPENGRTVRLHLRQIAESLVDPIGVGKSACRQRPE